MSKKRIRIVSILVLITLSIVSITVAIASDDPDLAQADQFIKDSIEEKKKLYPKPTPVAPADFYDDCSTKAKAQSQKDDILQLKKDKSKGVGHWKRAALIIIGELPKDQKRLTVQEAARIVKDNKNSNVVLTEFDKIAGAPDFEGGSGIHRIIYYLNDQGTEAIYVMNGRYHHVIFQPDGKQVSIPLEEGITPAPMESPAVS